MEIVRVLNATRGTLLAERARVADGWWARLRGLLGHPLLAPGDGLLLDPCTSVHTFGMRYAIDVAFLDDDGAVVALYPRLKPARISRWHRNAVRALELPDGVLTATRTSPGDRLLLARIPSR